MKYLSLDYWKEVQKIAATDNEFGIKAKMFAASFTFKVVDKADLPIIYAKFNGGKMEEVRELGAGEKTDFTLEGTYVIWSQVNKNELAADNAIMSRQLQFKGNMNTIMRYSKAFLRLFQLMQKIPVDY
ncbi:MAG: SCP2 sterol-binding domain-containing protein [Candidatus Bathyarchaeota archaeon]|nr:SCP2 sterol-binding domain-containing protein [Candidatus Bathyarchaeota archaeon]